MIQLYRQTVHADPKLGAHDDGRIVEHDSEFTEQKRALVFQRNVGVASDLLVAVFDRASDMLGPTLLVRIIICPPRPQSWPISTPYHFQSSEAPAMQLLDRIGRH